MATSPPAGDPGLSQNAGQAQLQWQNRPQKTVQFTGLGDAAAASGNAANPNAAPPPPPDAQEAEQPRTSADRTEGPKQTDFGGWENSSQQAFAKQYNLKPPMQAQTSLGSVGGNWGGRDQPGYGYGAAFGNNGNAASRQGGMFSQFTRALDPARFANRYAASGDASKPLASELAAYRPAAPQPPAAPPVGQPPNNDPVRGLT